MYVLIATFSHANQRPQKNSLCSLLSFPRSRSFKCFICSTILDHELYIILLSLSCSKASWGKTSLQQGQLQQGLMGVDKT